MKVILTPLSFCNLFNRHGILFVPLYLIIVTVVVRVFLIVIDGVSGETVSTLIKLDDTVSNI